VSGRHSKEALLEALAEPLAADGIDVEDVEVSSAGRRRVVRVLIDKDGGISLDDITDATRRVSTLLDDGDVMGEAPYTLEVTSPGVDRPLTLPRHWRRNVDRLVKVTPHQGPPMTGHILAADETGATIGVDGSSVRVSFADIAKARVEVEFNRSGARRGKRQRTATAGEPPPDDPATGDHDENEKE
jgi:ribosome maturation factor RimP